MQPVMKATQDSMTENEARFEVFIDEDDLQQIFSDEGNSLYSDDSEKDKEYFQRFQNEELCSFGVVKMKVCKCCCLWSEVDSLWGIHAESPQQALELFKKHIA